MAEFHDFLFVSVTCGVLILLAALAAPSRFRRISAGWRCLVWMILALRLLLPFDISVPGSVIFPTAETLLQARWQEGMDHEGQKDPVQSADGNSAGNIAANQADWSGNGSQKVSQQDASGGGSQKSEQPDASDGGSQKSALSAPAGGSPGSSDQTGRSDRTGSRGMAPWISLWLAGALVSLLWCLWGCYGSAARLGRFRTPAGQEIEEAIRQAAEKTGVRKVPAVYRCSCIQSPMAAGLFRPAVYLPPLSWSQEELALILAHECTHIRRRDLKYQAILLAARCVHWFNPAVWLMVRLAREDMELACDEAVARTLDRRQRCRYSETLLSVAGGQREKKTLLSTQFNGDWKALKNRVVRMMDEKPRKKGVMPTLLLLGLLAFVSLFAACGTGKDERKQDASSPTADTTSPDPDSMFEGTSVAVSDIVVTYTEEAPGDPSRNEENSAALTDILLANVNGVRYYLRQWSEEDAKREAYVAGGSNYPIRWLGKLMREENGSVSELDALVDYETVAEEGLLAVGDRLIYHGMSGYGLMEMKNLSYISISLDGTDRRVYGGNPWMTSRLFSDNRNLYFESYEGETDDNQYPRLIMQMTPKFEQVEEAARIEGMLVAVSGQNVYYIANDQAEKPGIYELSLEKGASPRLYDKLDVACSTSHWSDVAGVSLLYDMADRLCYRYQFQEGLGKEPLDMRLEIRKDFDKSTLETFSGPVMVKGNVVIVFAEESGGLFRNFEPLNVAMPAGLEIETGQYVEIFYNGSVMETYPAQVQALSVDGHDNPAFLRLPENLTAEEAGQRGFYTTVNQEVLANEESLRNFSAAASEPFPAFFRKVAYVSGEEGGYVVDVYYDGEKFVVMEGRLQMDSQEKEGTLKNLGSKTTLWRTFRYLYVFGEGDQVVLSNEEGLTEQKWKQQMSGSGTDKPLDNLILN